VTPDELRKKLKDLDIELSPQSRDSRISETRKLLKPLELEITSAKEKEAYTEEEAGKYVLVNRRKK
jgi:hypothetical protein